MPFKQHLSSTTGRETFASKVCLRENGGRWLTGGTTGRKRPNNCWGVKVQKFFSLFFFYPLSSWKRKLSRSRDCQMLFFICLLWGTRKPERPPLQQFSNHPISKLGSFQMLCAVQTSWDSLLCAAWIPPCLPAEMKLQKLLFFSFFSPSEPPPPPFFTRRSLQCSPAVKCRSNPCDHFFFPA